MTIINSTAWLEELAKTHIFLDFRPESADCVKMTPTHAGIIPDRGSETDETAGNDRLRVGIFADEMPQNVITRVVNYGLDAILLCGKESPTLIRNLRATVVPDLRASLQIWKTAGADTPEAADRYADCVDVLLRGSLL